MISHKQHRVGTHRSIAPELTLQRVAPYLTEFGITRVADVTGMDHIGIPTVMVVRPNARSLSVSQGKGADLCAAKVSGIMEAIEQHHAEHAQCALRLCSADELSGAVDTARLPGFARRYERQMRILWAEARSLDDARALWVPYELVHLDLRLPLPPGSGYFLCSSNGLASGNTRSEAVVHGLCELIERDALTLFFRRPADEQARRRLDLHTVDDALCVELLGRYRAAGMRIGVWEITSELGVPGFLCWIVDDPADAFRQIGLAQGSGCHPSRAIALARALCEAAQSRLTRIVGARDDIRAADFASLRADESLERYRAVLAQPGLRAFDAGPDYDSERVEDDIVWLHERLAPAGVEVALVDLSLPRYPFYVVRAIAAGLEASSELPGYRPGSRALGAA